MIDPLLLAEEFSRVFGCELQLQQPASAEFADWSLLAQAMGQYIQARRAATAQVGMLVAVSGPQGSGKSTLAAVLCDYLQSEDIVAATVSLDDFYLTRQQRRELATRVHPLLATRGVPGTHDHAALHECLHQVRQSGAAAEILLPVFDKALDDRSAVRSACADVLIVEGWCMGVQAQPAAALVDAVNELEQAEDPQGIWRRWVNAQIAGHYQPMWSLFDAWVYLRVPGIAQVFAWRRQQEQQLPPAQRMDNAQLHRFIAHYQRLTEWQWQCAPYAPALTAEMDEQHNVAAVNLFSSA